MNNYKSIIVKNIDTLSDIVTDIAGLGDLLCEHYEHLSQSGYEYKQWLFLSNACYTLADKIAFVNDDLLEILHSPNEDDAVVSINKNNLVGA